MAVRGIQLFLCIALVGCGSSRVGFAPTGGTDQSPTEPTPDASLGAPDFSLSQTTVDGGSSYTVQQTDSGACVPPAQPPVTCTSPIAANAGCGAVEVCGNGLDDNCDGQVDEGCSCTPGAVQSCFLGPPGKRHVGACTDGTQTCEGTEFGRWGACKGTISPSAETCDKLDNDCNGCADDGLCCATAINCPAPGDQRIADVPPFSIKALNGEDFFPGPAIAWKWTVVGGPCDELFSTTTGNPPVQSYTLTNPNQRDASVAFTLSGDYTVTLDVTAPDGTHETCTWVQHVIGPGVRIELCWDTTGRTDLDLHVHKPGSPTPFFNATAGTTTSVSNDDCNYQNCKASSSSPAPNWGYTNSVLSECSGGPEGPMWSLLGSCRNPRLDIDNIIDLGRPENVNIDKPNNGDTFRALVHFYGGTGVVTHPIVNIYCGGSLQATYGQAPNQLSGFSTAGGWAAGDMWRVADVTATVNSSGVTTGCTVTPLHPLGSTSGYRLGHDGKVSYEGN
jgi:hypothetical protein